MRTPTVQQEAIFEWVRRNRTVRGAHLVVQAGPGAGKTTTIEGIVENIPASDRTLVCPFNKDITEVLKERLPERYNLWVQTLHSHGLSRINYDRRQAGEERAIVDGDKVKGIIAEFITDEFQFRTRRGRISKLVSLVKNTMARRPDLEEVCDRHGIECDPEDIDLVKPILRRCRQDARVDFDDMIWIPVVNKLSSAPFRWVIVDESQDLNQCQIELILSAVAHGGHVICVGDPHQSIYGFRGADTEAMDRIIERLDADLLPLSVTFRCPTSVVELAQTVMPELEARPGAPEGEVRRVGAEDFLSEVETGDMVLCRTNAPIITPVLELLRAGRKANIRGRDIKVGLIALVERQEVFRLSELIDKLSDWCVREVARAMAQEKERKARMIQDRTSTIFALCDGLSTVPQLLDRIRTIFSDESGDGVIFSTVHRAKGLESDRVFLLRPDLLPLRFKNMQDWQVDEETNIQFVAWTRAASELIFVDGEMGAPGDWTEEEEEEKKPPTLAQLFDGIGEEDESCGDELSTHPGYEDCGDR